MRHQLEPLRNICIFCGIGARILEKERKYECDGGTREMRDWILRSAVIEVKMPVWMSPSE